MPVFNEAETIQEIVEAARPEGLAMQWIAELGFPFFHAHTTLGLHYYEQWYRDVYRKGFCHAHKFGPAVEGYWRPMWERLAPGNRDYQVALLGMWAGREFEGTVMSDIRQFPAEDVERILREDSISESGELPPDSMSPRQIDDFTDAFLPTPEFWAWEAWSRENEDNAGVAAKLLAGARDMG
jgi:hypothetical protein